MEIVETRLGLVQESKTLHDIKIGPKSKNRGAGNHVEKEKNRGKKYNFIIPFIFQPGSKKDVFNSHVLSKDFKTMRIFKRQFLLFHEIKGAR